ncbi:fam-b protein [Plasmodium vinckei]|uniref:Fam-b protein n=1 Tax=Plasmodium vinckei TaxID=5860 RepID=A0A6V7SAL6_PLAVN|nr:fam-b protein [Plasmodium vinckei]CAD2102384.1 fam-b protein [Plasmodium vinckei]
MRVNILNVVFLSIIICSFGFGKNELYFINERSICLERNIINFRNNRILADVENQFDLNNFYQSTWSLVNQLNDCNDDDEEITNLRNAIDSHIKNLKENNTLPNLNNLDGKTKKLIHKIQKELNEAKKELDNKGNGELSIQPIQDKRVIKENENIFEIDKDKFDDKYDEIESSDYYKKSKNISKYKKSKKKLIINVMLLIIASFVIIASGAMKFLLLLIPCVPIIVYNSYKVNQDRPES